MSATRKLPGFDGGISPVNIKGRSLYGTFITSTESAARSHGIETMALDRFTLKGCMQFARLDVTGLLDLHDFSVVPTAFC
jgi:hypothetical protein